MSVLRDAQVVRLSSQSVPRVCNLDKGRIFDSLRELNPRSNEVKYGIVFLQKSYQTDCLLLTIYQ